MNVSADFNLHSGPRVFGQSLKKVHTCSVVYLQHSRVSAGETRPSSFSPLEVWFAGWASLLSPPPITALANPPPSEELTWNDFHIGLILDADWPGESALPQGSPTNGDTTAWLIGRGQVAPLHFFFFLLPTAAIALSFFFFLLPLLQFCFCGGEKGVWALQWSAPSHSFDPLWMHSGLLPVTAFPVCLSLGRLQLWTLSPEPCSFEVSDELFFAFARKTQQWEVISERF